MVRFVLALSFVTACASHVEPGTGDGNTGASCTGSATRCEASSFEKCVNGTFVVQSNCAGTCSPTLGCVQCDPAGGNTCNGSDVVTCNSDGTFGTTVTTCGPGTMCSIGGTCTRACTADGVDLVYVVDEQNHFLSFDPRKLPADAALTLIGTLSCPATGQSIQQPTPTNTTPMPFSMSVDRDGVAWVLYTNGQLFKVSLQTAACTAAGNTVSASNMHLFGMGFVTDTPGANTEKLYIAGGNFDPSVSTGKKVAYDDTHGNNLTPTVVGNLGTTSDYAPELTGTGEAKLYGFYPNITAPAFVQEIDKATGAGIGMRWDLGTTGLGSAIQDWAYAQWGGAFYVFVTTEDIPGTRNSTIRKIDRTTSAYTVVKQNLPYFIDGAGVSTCAPVVIQ